MSHYKGIFLVLLIANEARGLMVVALFWWTWYKTGMPLPHAW